MIEMAEEGAMHQTEKRCVERVARQDEKPDVGVTASDQLASLLREAGLLVERPDIDAFRPPISDEKRKELARRFSAGKPLSQIIIEDRD